MEKTMMDKKTVDKHLEEWKKVLADYESQPKNLWIDYRIEAIKRLIAQYST
jgi:chaperonin cofactor prefoldin|tara:strand:+ start:1862 stop:2014 length:153 start_codon:yes stop_codon:yes gene_type:complete